MELMLTRLDSVKERLDKLNYDNVRNNMVSFIEPIVSCVRLEFDLILDKINTKKGDLLKYGCDDQTLGVFDSKIDEVEQLIDKLEEVIIMSV